MVEFIYYSFFVKNTCVPAIPLCTHVLAMKNVCVLHVSMAHSLFVWDNRDIRGLRCAMLEFVSATFFERNTSYLRFRYSIILKNVLTLK